MIGSRSFCPALVVVLLLLATSSHAIECDMALAFKQKDGNAKNGLTAVFRDGRLSAAFLPSPSRA